MSKIKVGTRVELSAGSSMFGTVTEEPTTKNGQVAMVAIDDSVVVASHASLLVVVDE